MTGGEDFHPGLADAVADFEQVLITAAVFGDVPEQLARHTVHIEAGRIVEVEKGD